MLRSRLGGLMPVEQEHNESCVAGLRKGWTSLLKQRFRIDTVSSPCGSI